MSRQQQQHLHLSAHFVGPAAQRALELLRQSPEHARQYYRHAVRALHPYIEPQHRGRFPLEPPRMDSEFAQLLAGAMQGAAHARRMLDGQ
jgi:hypothetical protein